MTDSKLCSVVVPCYNEEANVQRFYEVLTSVLDGLDFASEIIFIDDGSSDQTYEIIRVLAQQDGRVKLLRFSRNFGSHAALSAGLHRATGDFAIMISVDLQDPPDLIPELVKCWREGFHVVWAVRRGRDDPLRKKMFAQGFYGFFRRIALSNYPPLGMDFGLLDRRVLDAFNGLHESNHYIMGMIVWLGFRQAQVHYHRRGRHKGGSKWHLAKSINKAIDAFVSFSYVPIRVASYLGLLVCSLTSAYVFFLIVHRLIIGHGEFGWPIAMVAIFFLGGVQLITLGVLGEYVWRGVEQTRGRPLYVIMEQIGFDNEYSRPPALPEHIPGNSSMNKQGS